MPQPLIFDDEEIADEESQERDTAVHEQPTEIGVSGMPSSSAGSRRLSPSSPNSENLCQRKKFKFSGSCSSIESDESGSSDESVMSGISIDTESSSSSSSCDDLFSVFDYSSFLGTAEGRNSVLVRSESVAVPWALGEAPEFTLRSETVPDSTDAEELDPITGCSNNPKCDTVPPSPALPPTPINREEIPPPFSRHSDIPSISSGPPVAEPCSFNEREWLTENGPG